MPGWCWAEALPGAGTSRTVWPPAGARDSCQEGTSLSPVQLLPLNTPACSLSRVCGGQVTRFRHAAMLQMDPGGSIVFWHRTSDAKLDPHRFLPPWAAQAQYLTLPLSPAHAMQVHGGGLCLGGESRAVVPCCGSPAAGSGAERRPLGRLRPAACQRLSCSSLSPAWAAADV